MGMEEVECITIGLIAVGLICTGLVSGGLCLFLTKPRIGTVGRQGERRRG